MHIISALLLFRLIFVEGNQEIISYSWESKEKLLSTNAAVHITSMGTAQDEQLPYSALLRIQSNQSSFQGSLLELHGENVGSALIKAVMDGVVTFELSSSGYIKTAGLRMLSGGIQVDAGGIQIQSGGMKVKGGLFVESGGLNMGNQPFLSGRLVAVSKELMAPLIEAKTEASQYIGNMISLQSNSEVNFNYLYLERSSEEVFSVDQNGSLVSRGDALFRGQLTVEAETNLQGRLAVACTTILAAEEINILVYSSCLLIADDGEVKLNKVRMNTNSRRKESKMVAKGTLLFISNEDAEPTSGDIYIPAYSTVLLIWNGKSWKSIDALGTPIETLSGISSFTASKDLNIGNVTFEAGQFRSSGLTKGSLLTVGAGGVIVSAKGMTYNEQNSELSVSSLNVQQLTGSLNANSHIISNAVMSNLTVKSGSISVDSISVNQQNGVAVFNHGLLSSSNKILTDLDGNLLLRDVHNNINMHSHDLVNVNIKNANLRDIQYANFQELSTSSIGGFKLLGEINANNQIIRNALLVNGEVRDLDRVSAKSFRFSSTPVIYDDSISNLVIADSQGEMHIIDGKSELQLSAVTAKSLKMTGDLDMGGNRVRHMSHLEANTGDFQVLQTRAMTMNTFPSIPCTSNCTFVGANANGELGQLDFASIINKVLDDNKNHENISALHVETDILRATEGRIGNIFSDIVRVTKTLETQSIVAESIIAKDIKISGSAQIQEDLFVSGSVIGSGPYVDSSDIRLKTNITPFVGALDGICAINTVYFDYRREEYPQRNFPKEMQIGWVADAVQEVFPHLVVEDSEGFKAVAYSRASAVVAEAVKELRRETNDRLDFIVRELANIRAEVAALRSR